MKVTHLSSVHKADDGRIFYKECQSLAKEGFDVSYVVPANGDITVNGVRICSVPFPANRLERFTKCIWRVARRAISENADIYHFHDPELIPVGLYLKLLGKTVVRDVHEDYGLTFIVKHWIPAPIRRPAARFMTFVERMSSSFFDRIVAATPSIARRFLPDSAVEVQNFAMSSEVDQSSRTPYAARPQWIVYAGRLMEVCGLREMVEAMSLQSADSKTRLKLAGPDEEFLPSVLAGPGGNRTDYLGFLSRGELDDLLNSAVVGLVVLHPTPNHIESQPTKMFDYMNAGIPVVASDFPWWRNIIEKHGCGILVDPLNAAEIASAIRWMIEHPEDAEEMGKRGRIAASKFFSWQAEFEKLVAMYHELSKDLAG